MTPLVLLASLVLVQPARVEQTTRRVPVRLQPVSFTQVAITDGFWAPRRETNRTVSIPHSLDMLEKAGNIRNLDRAISGARSGYEGPVFMDSDLYKAIEAASYSLATDPDPALSRRIDAIIERIAAAQMKDGYLNTWYQVNEPDKRWTNLRDNHELYCAGHLMEAAVAHFAATGKRTLLDVATRFADHIDRIFGNGPGKRMGYPGHPEIELALVKLWRATGERRYFELARFFVENRGIGFFATEHNTPRDRYDGTYWQDNVPIREHRRIVGHAVRAAYLMAGVVDVMAETGDTALEAMIQRVWRNTTERNTYITGGIGPSAHNEGFTTDYDLPNLTAYQETCASVAMILWNHRLALLYGDSRYADAVETALYNGFLAGVSLDGKRFFYVNPLESLGGHHRSEWFGCACCPPNVTRTLASLGHYAYGVGEDGLWVNLYIQGSMKTSVRGTEVALDVKTIYPWDGEIRLEVKPARPTRFGLRLRVPGWCQGAWVEVNGEKQIIRDLERGYFRLEREWKAGDVVDLHLPMPVRLVQANPHVKENRGKLAIARGPLVYAAEAVDQTEDLRLLAVPVDSLTRAEMRKELLGGVVAVTAEAVPGLDEPWGRLLYRPLPLSRRAKITLVPYYAWDNREAGAMRVWHPVTPPEKIPGGPERDAEVSLSFRSGNCQPWGINDGVEPESSGQQPAALCHWWPHKGGTEWAQYTWKAPRRVSGTRVYWFDDTGRGECRLPKAWRIEYLVGSEWRPVPGAAQYPVHKDGWIEVHFDPIEVTALRLVVEMQPGWAAGVHEWQVIEAEDE